jgi:hypothetical protein
MMMLEVDTERRLKAIPLSRQAICPTCGAHTTMIYVGDQKWPTKVAAVMGIEPTVKLWECTTCLTTITESKPKR